MKSQEYDNINSKVDNQFNTKEYLKKMDMILFMVNLVMDYADKGDPTANDILKQVLDFQEQHKLE
jgi:hypothetical protein